MDFFNSILFHVLKLSYLNVFVLVLPWFHIWSTSIQRELSCRHIQGCDSLNLCMFSIFHETTDSYNCNVKEFQLDKKLFLINLYISAKMFWISSVLKHLFWLFYSENMPNDDILVGTWPLLPTRKGLLYFDMFFLILTQFYLCSRALLNQALVAILCLCFIPFQNWYTT